MREILIPIHSVIDVITNSSSVIYTEASNNAIAQVKHVVNAILASAGVQMTADDLYNFQLVTRPEDLHDWLNYLEDLDEFEGTPLEPLIPEIKTIQAISDWKTRSQAVSHLIEGHRATLDAYFATQSYDRYSEQYPVMLRHIVITDKNGNEVQFAENMKNVFESWESYN